MLVTRPQPQADDWVARLQALGAPAQALPLMRIVRREGFDAAVAEAEELLRFALCDANGNWTADYVRLRVEAAKS